MSCKCSCNCQPTPTTTNKPCPVCDHIGKAVPFDAVKSLTKPEKRESLTDTEYVACMNPDCKAVYFDDSNILYLEDLNRPIWFKTGSEPKIACYCNNISYDQIKDAVKDHELTSWKEIVLHYRPQTICMCNKLNPTGECCTENFYKIINQALREQGKKPITTPENCCD